MALSSLLQKLLFIKQFNISDGKVEILGNNYIMLDASDLLALQTIDKTKMYGAAKNSSKENLKSLVEHASVYKSIKDESVKNIAELSKKIGKNDDGIIKTLQSLFEIYGLGKLTIINLDNSKKQATLKVENSTLAMVQLKKSKSKNCVCTLTSGILAGIFSYIFNSDADCIEKKCLAKGDQFCYFEIN